MESPWPEVVPSVDMQLNKNVIVGYTDIAAAGCRALLGIDMRTEYHTLDVAQLVGAKPACTRDRPPSFTEQNFQPLQILNHKYEEKRPFSLIIINTMVPGNKCHYVINNLMELCAQSPAVRRLIVLSVLHLDGLQSRNADMYENTIGASPLTNHKPLPGHTPVADPLLCTLLQMVLVEGIPTNCLVRPGHRAATGQANSADGSKQHIARFQQLLDEVFGLRMSAELSNTLLYKGQNEDSLDPAPMVYI